MVETTYLNNTSTRDTGDIENLVYKDCPLTALSAFTTKILANSLNNVKVIHAAGGYERDWRGLATLSEQRDLCADNTLCSDPFQRLLQLWCEHKPETATFGNLILYLGIIDRWHIIEDVQDNLLKDYQDYQHAEQHLVTPATTSSNVEISYNNQSVNSTPASTYEYSPSSIPLPREQLDYDFEAKLLTSNDVQCYQHGLPLEQYDAFILYADRDYKHALEILSKLQNNRLYQFTFCLKDDLLFGIPFEHIALMELIRERCTFLIAILTQEFITSPENRFFVNYAQALQIKQEIRKVIPLLYEDNVAIPANLAMFSRMRYNPYRTDLYWAKLADSMQLTQVSVSEHVTNPRRRLLAVNQHRNLALEATTRLALTTLSSAPKEKLLSKTKPTTKGKHYKSKACVTNPHHSLASGDSQSRSSNRSRSFLKRLICCSR